MPDITLEQAAQAIEFMKAIVQMSRIASAIADLAEPLQSQNKRAPFSPLAAINKTVFSNYLRPDLSDNRLLNPEETPAFSVKLPADARARGIRTVDALSTEGSYNVFLSPVFQKYSASTIKHSWRPQFMESVEELCMWYHQPGMNISSFTDIHDPRVGSYRYVGANENKAEWLLKALYFSTPPDSWSFSGKRSAAANIYIDGLSHLRSDLIAAAVSVSLPEENTELTTVTTQEMLSVLSLAQSLKSTENSNYYHFVDDHIDEIAGIHPLLERFYMTDGSVNRLLTRRRQKFGVLVWTGSDSNTKARISYSVNGFLHMFRENGNINLSLDTVARKKGRGYFPGDMKIAIYDIMFMADVLLGHGHDSLLDKTSQIENIYVPVLKELYRYYCAVRQVFSVELLLSNV